MPETAVYQNSIAFIVFHGIVRPMKQIIQAMVSAGILCAIAGCASIPMSIRSEETAFLALHAVDGFQTANIRNTPDTYEVQSRWAIGREPSVRSTAAYFAAIALVHIAITDYLCAHHAKPWIIQAWELGGIAWDVDDVAHNYKIGIKP